MISIQSIIHERRDEIIIIIIETVIILLSIFIPLEPICG